MISEFIMPGVVTVCASIILSIITICGRKKNQSEEKIGLYSEEFIEKIITKEYLRSHLPNDWDEYPGENEKKDTEEFIQYINSGILNKFDGGKKTVW